MDTPERLLSLKEVQEQINLGPTAIYARIKDQDFPAPVKLGKVSRWSQREVNEWVLEKLSKRF